MAELSPMMRQYFTIKDQHKNCILMFRLGDFYEMFFEDAKLAAQELELTLTGRDCGLDERAPMCGVPHHSAEGYIARLVAKGYKVAICEQTKDPATAKGIVKRDVVRVITPGTVIESGMLDEARNNYIASCFLTKDTAAICFSDISTGTLMLTDFSGDNLIQSLKNELARFSPSELIINTALLDQKDLTDFIKLRIGCTVELYEDDFYNSNVHEEHILQHFKKERLEELSIAGKLSAISSLSALLNYLGNTQKSSLERISTIEYYSEAQYMTLDLNTRRNLELTETMRTGQKKGSLIWVLDKTKTAMGKRLLRSWVESPLLSAAYILRRQNAVENLFDNPILRSNITESLSQIYDLERILTRILCNAATARELRTLAFTLEHLPGLKFALSEVKAPLLTDIAYNLDTLDDLRELIDNAITDDPPVSLKEGGIIKTGYHPDVDNLRDSVTNGKDYIAKIEASEREKTGIPKLKIGYNRVFGYYLEITNSYKSMVPPEYIRKQTLSNCERYITDELKSLEVRILGANERLVALEYDIFNSIREKLAVHANRLQKTAELIAQLDVLTSFAEISSQNNYVRPEVNVSGKIVLKDSRHPVIEQLLKGAAFVPNDVLLDKSNNRMVIITGPNMAGKSTYMRQVALISIMAQIGCFVPAASAEIGIVDRVFTRVGASDDLASGQSTFMVEMTEVADILKYASKDSLILLDEIGRGTSTFDGMSIARAVVEHVSDPRRLGAKTMFATHYHELTELEQQLDGIKNYNIAVRKRSDDIIFLRRIVRGGCDDSYGIEVAKLAGVPENVITRAKQVLKALEERGELSPARRKKKQEELPLQTTLLSPATEEILSKLRNLDPGIITPIEALNVLYELTDAAKKI